MAKPWCKQLADYEVVAESDGRRVAIAIKLEKEVGKFKPRDKAKIFSWIQKWCEDHDGNIPEKYYKPQDRYRDSKGRMVSIIAFKAYQARLYGFIRDVEGKSTFLITAADADKKDDQADQKVLSRAKDAAFRILEALKIR